MADTPSPEETDGGGRPDEQAGDGAGEAAGAAGPDAVRDEEIVDERDLDAAGYVGPTCSPTTTAAGCPATSTWRPAACLTLWLLVDDSPYVNRGYVLAAVC